VYCLASFFAKAQTQPRTDSLPHLPMQDTLQESSHSVKKAVLLSACLPGAGQAYNRKYWKMPIIYGGYAGLIYLIIDQNKQYRFFQSAYKQKLNDPSIEFTDTRLASNNLLVFKENRDYYRKNRDLFIICIAGLHLLQVLDASVDAHLFDYDISEKLSLHWQPNATIQSQSVCFGTNFLLMF